MKQSDIKTEKRDFSKINYNVPSNSKIYIAMGKGDNNANECYTTYKTANNLVQYLLNYPLIEHDEKIWFPFDCEDSNIYLAFKNNGFKNLIYTHFENSENFYEMEVDCDIIISNPPFSRHKIGDKSYGRTDLFNRLFKLDKPFIMLQPTQMLNNLSIIKHLTEKSPNIGFICPENRTGFIINGIEKNSPAFYSFWMCYKMGLSKMWNNM